MTVVIIRVGILILKSAFEKKVVVNRWGKFCAKYIYSQYNNNDELHYNNTEKYNQYTFNTNGVAALLESNLCVCAGDSREQQEILLLPNAFLRTSKAACNCSAAVVVAAANFWPQFAMKWAIWIKQLSWQVSLTFFAQIAHAHKNQFCFAEGLRYLLRTVHVFSNLAYYINA